MKYMPFVIVLLFSNSCSLTKECLSEQELMSTIVNSGEEYFKSKENTDDPYLFIQEEINAKNSKEDIKNYFCKHTQLLKSLFIELSVPKRESCYNYFIDTRISDKGLLYLTYSLGENSFISSLVDHENSFIKDYASSVISCGDICPSLVIGTQQWNIDKNSDIEERALFFLHVIILANRCVNTDA